MFPYYGLGVNVRATISIQDGRAVYVLVILRFARTIDSGSYGFLELLVLAVDPL